MVPLAALGDGLRRHRGDRGLEESQRDRTGARQKQHRRKGKEGGEGLIGPQG